MRQLLRALHRDVADDDHGRRSRCISLLVERLHAGALDSRDAHFVAAVRLRISRRRRVEKPREEFVCQTARLRSQLQQLGLPLRLESIDLPLRERRRAEDFTQQRERRRKTIGHHRHRDGGLVPIGLRVDRRSQLLESFGELGAVVLLGALEHQLRREPGDAFLPGGIAHGAGVDHHGDRHDGKLRHRRDDQLESVVQPSPREARESDTRVAALATAVAPS